MEKEGKNTLSAITIIVGVFLLIFAVDGLKMMSRFLSYYIFTPVFYIYLDLVILAIIIFLYAFFLLKPMKTLQGKKNLKWLD